MSIIINNDNYVSEVVKSDKPVLIDFFATWCAPCRMVAPILEEIAAERDDIKICKVDVDECPALATEFGVSSIPMLVVIKSGRVTAASVGLKPKEAIIELIDNA